jgi:hypothetical protein
MIACKATLPDPRWPRSPDSREPTDDIDARKFGASSLSNKQDRRNNAMTNDCQELADGDTLNGQTERPPPGDAIRFDDLEYVRKWLTALREQVDHGLTAAEDATRPVRKRFFSRHEARRRIEEATKAIENLLDAAERGLP